MFVSGTIENVEQGIHQAMRNLSTDPEILKSRIQDFEMESELPKPTTLKHILKRFPLPLTQEERERLVNTIDIARASPSDGMEWICLKMFYLLLRIIMASNIFFFVRGYP